MSEDHADGAAGLWERLWRKFGDVARAMGLAKGEDVEEALEAQKELRSSEAPHKKVGHILVEKGKMEPAHVNKVLSKQRKDADTIAAKAAEAKRAAVPIDFPDQKGAAKPAKKSAKKKAKAKAGKAATKVNKSGAAKKKAKTKKKAPKAKKTKKAKKKAKKKS